VSLALRSSRNSDDDDDDDDELNVASAPTSEASLLMPVLRTSRSNPTRTTRCVIVARDVTGERVCVCVVHCDGMRVDVCLRGAMTTTMLPTMTTTIRVRAR
jgi:hypothetical protein